MQVTVEIPDHFVSDLVPEGNDPARLMFEETVASAYREHRLTMEQVRQLLGYGTRMEVDVFLGNHQIFDYTEEEFQKDVQVLQHMFPSDWEKKA